MTLQKSFRILLISILYLFELRRSETTFGFITARIIQRISGTNELTDAPTSALSPRHYAMYCDFTPNCISVNYECDLNQCRIFSDWNGTTNGTQNDHLMIKNKFGFGKYLAKLIILGKKNTN